MSDIPDVKEAAPGMRKSMTGMPDKKINPINIQVKDSIVTSNQSIERPNTVEQVTIKKTVDS
jgi:hypothetical protein